MKVRLLADANVKIGIVRGLRQRDPTIDFLRAQEVIPERTADPRLLIWAANMERVLVSHDQQTMQFHFYRFIEKRQSPGLISIPQSLPIAQAIDGLHLLWACLEPGEFRNQILYI